MGDQLEQFVSKNRESFDSEGPSDKVWGAIASRKRRKPLVHLWKVAAILFLISTVYLIVERAGFRVDSPDGVPAELTEFARVETYYTQLIAQKKMEVTKLAGSDLERDFLKEIETLDEMYTELKQTYMEQNSTDLLTDAMINNLQLRIEILNQQLAILIQLKQQQDGKVSISQI